MLEQYLSLDGFIRIPMTANRYCISITGKVIGPDGKEVIQTLDEGGDLQIWGELYNGFKFYKVAVLMAIVFKNTKLPFKFWDQLNVLFIDSDKTNIHPGNLIWKFPKNGFKGKNLNGFRYIPGCSQYLINKEGEVYSVIKKCLLNKNKSNNYFSYSVVLDIGKKTVLGRHRALALAWLDYPSNVDILDVNHINGIPGDDILSNLEWCTRQHNCIHAYSTGLRTDNHPIEVKNIFTNEINRYYSYSECSRVLNTNDATICWRVKSRGQIVYDQCFLFKKEGDPFEWISLDEAKKNNLFDNYNAPIKIKNVITGEIKVIKGLENASKYTNIPMGTISLRLIDNTTTDYCFGYQFKRENDNSDWLDIKECITNNLKKEVKVKDIKTNVITTHNSITNAVLFTNVAKHICERILTTKDGRSYKGYQFKYFLDETPWCEIKDENYGYIKVNQPVKVKCLNVNTNEIIIFDTLRKAEKYTLVDHSTINSHFKNPNKSPSKGFKFSKIIN